ncbi:MAG: glycosyltransferase family 39 protein [Planctomycetes bacterium]|nr:glycosyltransferase family 39 protein [Planctomycetota bacterium]
MKPSRQFAILCLVSLATFFAGLGKRDLWNPVEPRYAAIAEGIAEGQGWLVPRYAGRAFDQKPPLYFWMSASALGGTQDPAWRRFLVRIPSALGGLALVLGAWVAGRRFFGGQAGFWAALVLATAWLPWWSSRFCHIDTLVAAAMLFAMLGVKLAWDAPGRAAWWRAVGLTTTALTMGLMLKGPGTLAFTLLSVLVYALLQRDRRFVSGSGLLFAIPVALSLAAMWFLPAWHSAGSAWAYGLAVDAGLLHLVDPENAPKHDRWYYFGALFIVAAPWAFLVPGAVRRSWRDRRGDDRAMLCFCLAWLLGILIVLNLGTTFRSRYLLPALVPIFLVVGRDLSRHLRRGVRMPLDLRVVAGGVALILLVAAGTALAAPDLGGSDVARLITQPGPERILFLTPIVLCAAAALVSAKHHPVRGFSFSVAALVIGVAAWGLCFAPALDQVLGAREVVSRVQEGIHEGRRLVAVESYHRKESTSGYWLFHAGVDPCPVDLDGRELSDLADHQSLLVLARRRDILRYPHCIPAGFHPILEDAGPQGVCVFINPRSP